MRTTIDIADEQYALLKARAAQEHTTVKALISEAVRRMLTVRSKQTGSKSFHLPTIGAKGKKTLHLTDERVSELLMDWPAE